MIVAAAEVAAEITAAVIAAAVAITGRTLMEQETAVCIQCSCKYC
jgi:hypothetical protein